MSERFYVSFPLALGEVDLDESEAHHLRDVSRHREGDRVILFNGDGAEYAALIQTIVKKRVVLSVQQCSRPDRELPFQLNVAAPLPKGDRAQFLIEKLTELGVSSFTPLQTARSVIQPREAKIAKLERYAIEACKQCGRNVLMMITPLTQWRDFAAAVQLPAAKWIAHPGGTSLHECLSGRQQRLATGQREAAGDVAIAIGPEGGWTDDELACAKQSGWSPIDMGPRILRMETAAIALAACIGTGDLGG